MARGKKRDELTREQLREMNLQRELEEIEEQLHMIPEPKEMLPIGTPVRSGHLRDAVIEEILLEGKAYKIDYADFINNYGNPIRIPHSKRIVKWTNVRRLPKDDVKILHKKDDLKLSYSQRYLCDLFGKMYSFGVDLDPDYQRDYVWSLEDKVNLIDSIFHNVDIGKFVFIENDHSSKYLYEILDGKQRMRAILDYYEDKFTYEGLFYSDLSTRDQSFFENYPINIAEIRNATREQKLQYFLKLNTGGRIMSKEHLAKVRQMLEESQIQ